MKRIIFILSVIYVNILFGSDKTAGELLNPSSNAYDFTYNLDTSNQLDTYSSSETINKVEMNVEKIVGYQPRINVIFDCKNDTYGSSFCPEALSPAADYLSYSESQVSEKTKTIIDFEQGNYAEITSSVRDFMDGFANKSVGTVIDYNNGLSSSYTSNVIDYTAKITTKGDCPSGYISHRGKCFKKSGIMPWNSMIGYCKKIGARLTSCNEYCGSNTNCSDNPLGGQGGCTVSNPPVETSNVWDSLPDTKCISSVGLTGTSGGWCNWNYAICIIEPKVVSKCPSGYFNTANGCKKNISYKHYSYGCDSGYIPNNIGFSTYKKTDPNTSTRNDSTLDDAVNSATAPVGNCRKSVSYDYFDYNCSDGYTPVDAGLTTCQKTDSSTSVNSTTILDDACNDAAPPPANCYKDIKYKHYSYGCSDGYVTDNYGLSTCPKVDPNKSLNNSDSLDDACNSAIPPEGNCRKNISYSYYEYLCDGKNSFYESYTVLDGGLTECEKTDTDINSVNSSLSDACNSPTAPAGNCKSTEYTCNSNVFNPVFVDNQWQCSTYFCNEDAKCGYGICEGAVSQNAYMPTSMNIISTVVNSNPVNCNQNYEYDDGIDTKHIVKYCDNGYIENATCLEKDDSNNCIKFETTTDNAKCIQDDTNCTEGYTKINGVCTSEPTKSYYYHTYTCKNETNQFGENWQLLNNETDPECVDDTFGNCINFEKSTSNCKRLVMSCPNGEGECTLDSSVNQWKCTTEYSYIESNECNSPLCDLVLNDEISYCQNESCPTANGVYEEDGECKIMMCPDGTYESDGLCYTE